MEKYYCDICGKECKATKFTVPNMTDRTINGIHMQTVSEMNICNDCQNLIGCFIYGLKSNNKE